MEDSFTLTILTKSIAVILFADKMLEVFAFFGTQLRNPGRDMRVLFFLIVPTTEYVVRTT